METLLKASEVQRRLAMSRKTFYKVKPILIAHGLRELKISKQDSRYQASSVDALIANLPATGE